MSSTQFEQTQVEPVEQSQAKTQIDDTLVVEKTVQPTPEAEGAFVIKKQVVSMDGEEQKGGLQSQAAQVHIVCIVHFPTETPLIAISRSIDISGLFSVQVRGMHMSVWLSIVLTR